jgi:hypothetical protein
MEWLEKILVALASGAFLTVTTLYVTQRRLCAVLGYFAYSQISKNATTVTVTVLNRGHRTENDITLELDPKLHYDLIANSSADVVLDGSHILRVKRLPKLKDVAAIILVEHGDFSDKSVLNFSSATSKGTIYPSLEKVPVPPGSAAIVALIFLGLLSAVGFLGYNMFYDEVEMKVITAQREKATGSTEDPVVLAKAEALGKLGWKNTAAFLMTDTGKSYEAGEFPVAVSVRSRKAGIVTFDVVLWNKTPSWLTVSVNIGGARYLPNAPRTVSTTGDVLLPANSKRTQVLTAFIAKDDPPAVPMTGSIADAEGNTTYIAKIIPTPE